MSDARKAELLMCSTLCNFQLTQGEWADQVFVGQSNASKLRHLLKEVGEIIDAPDDVEEYGDALALLIDAARKKGIHIAEIIDSMWNKLEKNR
ncbi:MAG: dATP/dGTP pyrophosphohydrolase domain-containing protein, partial [Gammaproteobacteria bacterium]